MSNTAGAYQKGNDFRGYWNGLINILFPALLARSQVNTGSSVNFLSFLSLQAFQPMWTLDWLQLSKDGAACQEAVVIKVAICSISI